MKTPGIITLTRKNFLKRPYRNTILILCVTAVVLMQLMASLIDRASQQGLKLFIKRMGADLVAVPSGLSADMIHSFMTGKASAFYMDSAIKKKIQKLKFVEAASSQLFIKSLSGASFTSIGEISLIGFEPRTDFILKPWLSKQTNRTIGPGEIIVGAALQTKPGSSLKFYGHEFKVAGILAKTGMGLDTSVYMPLNTAYLMCKDSEYRAEKTLDIGADKISAVLIKLKPVGKGGIPKWKAAEILGKSIPEISIIQHMDIRRTVQRNIKGLQRALLSISYIVWPITALLIGLVFMMVANERQREIGLLRALGAKRSFIFRIIIFEALLVTGIGAIVGSIISIVLVSSFSRPIALKMEIPFRMPGAGDITVILLTATFLALLTGSIAAFIPALQASMREPYEAIRRKK